MTANQITRREARALARYISEARTTLGPQHAWDVAGIEAALYDGRELAPGPDLAVAAIRAAWNPANRTPAIIGLPGPHWRAQDATPRVRDVAPVGSRCTVCGLPEVACRTRWALTGDTARDEHQGRHEFTRPRERVVDVTPVIHELKDIAAGPKPELLTTRTGGHREGGST